MKYAKIILVIRMAKGNEKIWIFQNKKEMLVSCILFVIFLIGFIFLGTRDYPTETLPVNQATDINDYKEVPKDNVFKTINASEAYTRVRYDDIIILFGSSDNEWVGYYAGVINEAAKEVGINKIYYYDITEDRKNRNASYEATVNYFGNYITYIDNTTPDIFAPLLIVKKDGIITYFNESNAIIEGSISPEEYWNNYTRNMNKEELLEVFKDYKGEE